MKKKFKNKLDNGAIAKLASITSSAITTFKEKQKQKQKELAQKRKKEEFSKLSLENSSRKMIEKNLIKPKAKIGLTIFLELIDKWRNDLKLKKISTYA